jgi:hypothetical protein
VDEAIHQERDSLAIIRLSQVSLKKYFDMSLENLQQYTVLFIAMVPGLILAIAFLQSGWDKIAQRQGNLDWFKGHFAKTILGRWPAGALTYLTVLELAAGLSYILIVLAYFLYPEALVILYCGWIYLNGLTLISLFLGQRMAADYAGAASLTGYITLYLLGGVAMILPLWMN